MERKRIRISRILMCLVFIMCGLCMVSLTGKAAEGTMEGSLNYSNEDRKDNDILVKQYDIEIPSEGNYVVNVEWDADREGVLTGVIFSNGENSLFSLSAGGVFADSEPLELEKGSYTLKLYCLQSKEEEQLFWDLADSKLIEDEENEYNYAAGQKFKVTGNYCVEVTDENPPRSIWYVLGLVAGIVIGIMAVALIAWLAKKAGGKVGVFCKDKEKTFDERQFLARGQAYKVGFFTLIFYVVIAAILDEIFDIHILMSLSGMWIGVCLSIAIFAIICILKDAYISLQENARGIMIMFGTVGIMNICCSLLPYFMHGEELIETAQAVKNGNVYEYAKLSLRSLNLIAGILFLILIAVFAGKLWYDKKHEDEEE